MKTYDDNVKGHSIRIFGQDGKEAAILIYDPENPLSCGARVWLETKNRVDVYS